MRIFSGIQPTGRKHLGNYIGAIRQYVEGQDRGEAIYCIVDLHAITMPYEPSELRARLYDTTAILLAAGTPGKRLALPNSRILIHQPHGGFQGQATDIQIHAKESLALRRRMEEIYAEHTGRPVEEISDALERDRFFTPEEALDQLNDLITTFRTFVGGLKKDRHAILSSLDQISVLSVQTADLVQGIRKPFVEDIHQLRTVAENLDENKGEIDRALQVLPIKLEKVGRTAIYGSWFNFYLCQFQGKVTVAGLTVPVQYNTGSDRCALG
jgi:hypothetical protein